MTVTEDSTVSQELVLRALLTVIITAVVTIVVGTIFGVVAGFNALGGVVTGLLSWQTLVFVVLVGAVTVVWRRSTVRRRAGLYVVAALVAAAAELVIRVMQANAGSGILLFLPGFVLSASIAVACTAIGAYSAAGIPFSGRFRAPQLITIGSIVALVVSGALALALVGQWLGIYFCLFGCGQPDVTPEQETRYLVTAGFAIGLATLAAVLGGIRHVRALLVWAIVLAVTATLTAFVFQVPAGRFWPTPAEYSYDPPGDGPNGSDCQGDPSLAGCGG